MNNKEKEAKRNARNESVNVVDTAVHVEIAGSAARHWRNHNSHNHLDNPKHQGYPQYPQHDDYGFMQFL